MRQILAVLAVFGISASGYAASDCTVGHPKDKAECILKSTIESGSNTSIAKSVADFKAEGLGPSGEVSSTFVGGTCVGAGDCSFNYVVSTDFYTVNTFKTITVLVNSSYGGSIPVIKKVFDQSDLR